MPSRCPDPSRAAAPPSRPLQALLWLAVALLLALPTLAGAPLVDDPFHHGEYFAATVGLAQAGAAVLPLTIHGAFDFLPAMLARALSPADAWFAPTLVVYKLLRLAAAALLVWMVADLRRGKPWRLVWVIGAAALAPLTVDAKDVMLLLALRLQCWVGWRPVGSARWPLHTLLGIAVAAGLYWSFDRGIAGAVSLGAGTLLLSLRDPVRWVSLGTFGLCVGLLSLTTEVFSLQHHVDNILLLAETSAQWTYRMDADRLGLSAFALGANLLAVLLLVGSAVQQGRAVERAPAWLAAGLLAAFMTKIGINRADIGHIYMSLWVPLLAAALQPPLRGLPARLMAAGALLLLAGALGLAMRWHSYGMLLVAAALLLASGLPSGRAAWPRHAAAALLALFAAGLVASTVKSGVQAWHGGGYAWLAPAHHLPDNRASVAPGVRWAADELAARHAGCVFDLSNSGVINGLTGLPGCSRFTYPVYASAGHEAELIEAVQSRRPGAIVYAAEAWHYAIDGRTMRMRFPALDDVLRTLYPIERCRDGYCVRLLAPGAAPTAVPTPPGP